MSGQSWAARQLPLLKAADEILAFTGQGTKSGYRGYGDVTISVPSRLVTLYWHGTVPPALRARLARLRAAAPVHIVAAPYTWQQLETQARQIADARTGLAAAGYSLSHVGPDTTATGLTVGIDFTRSRALAVPAKSPSAASPSAAVPAPAKAAMARNEVQRLVKGPAPVTVSDSPLARSTGSRDLDDSPFWGGSRIVRDGNEICTSGFSVIKGSARYMVTAGHCGGVSTLWQTGDNYGTGNTMGTEVARNPCCDSAIISVGDNRGMIYDQGYLSATGEAVLGYRMADAPGTSVGGTAICTEGATSGVRCNIQTMATGQFVSFTDPAFTAENESLGMQMTRGQEAAAKGDSGGPVIINSGTAGKVYATGTISGGNGNVTCPSTNDPGAVPDCFQNVYFEEIIPILNLWGVNLVTAG